MAEAYKCDKCGQFRLSPESEDYQDISRITWTTVDVNGKNVWHDIDLCEACAPPVTEFLGEIEKTQRIE